MNTKNILDFTKWLLDNKLDNPRDNFKGNMKLQKLLFFAQLINLAKNNTLLFEDNFCAFENGMVMESVRLKYKNNLKDLLSYKANPLSEEELEVLELTKKIYGSEDADTLSDMTHQFSYWEKYFKKSNGVNNYKNKEKSIVPNKELEKELENIRDVLYAYEILNNNSEDSEEEVDY